MNKIRNILIIVLLAGVLTGCGTLNRTKSFSPNFVQLQINMDDLNYLGETEVSVTYNTYLGIITSIDKVNGEVYNPAEKKIVNLEGLTLDNQLRKSTYKVVEQFPQATYYQLVYKNKNINRLFLGREVVATARIRAYNFK